MRRAGELVQLRRGAYAEPSDTELDARVAHLQLLHATVPLCSPEAVVSHTSGFPATSLARTVVDLDACCRCTRPLRPETRRSRGSTAPRWSTRWPVSRAEPVSARLVEPRPCWIRGASARASPTAVSCFISAGCPHPSRNTTFSPTTDGLPVAPTSGGRSSVKVCTGSYHLHPMHPLQTVGNGADLPQTSIQLPVSADRARASTSSAARAASSTVAPTGAPPAIEATSRCSSTTLRSSKLIATPAPGWKCPN